MQDADIQEATASEPLSLEEEYAMQQSWRQGPDKLTFIACLPLGQESEAVSAGSEDGLDHMLGDVNLFLTISEEDAVIGEIELMIAVKDQQGHGYGRASLLAFLRFMVEHERGILEGFERERMSSGGNGIEGLVVKIGEANQRSIGLFESVGFERVGEGANYFGEWELRMGGEWRERVKVAWGRGQPAAYGEIEYRGVGIADM